MKFKIVNAHRVSEAILVSGFFVPEDGEQETLEFLREVLDEVNRTVDGSIQCDRFVANDRTILFKSIPIGTLSSVLMLLDNAFNLRLRMVMGKNMKNNALRVTVAGYFARHRF